MEKYLTISQSVCAVPNNIIANHGPGLRAHHRRVPARFEINHGLEAQR